MKRLFDVCGGAILAGALATPAAAQVVGTYRGTAADGTDIAFLVSTDASTGNLALTGAGIDFAAPCKNSSYVLISGWGFDLLADIVNRKVSYVAVNNYFVFTFNLKFSGDGHSATGSDFGYPHPHPQTDKPKKGIVLRVAEAGHDAEAGAGVGRGELVGKWSSAAVPLIRRDPVNSGFSKYTAAGPGRPGAASAIIEPLPTVAGSPFYGLVMPKLGASMP
jgi:hypothetical protein